MADFRKWIYAFAVVALLAGLIVPASAQSTAPTCTAIASSNTIVRAEGFTEQVGDITLNCTGGSPTAQGHAVPQVNIQVQLNTTITSRLLGTVKNSFSGSTVFNEALLIVDEPNSPDGVLNASTANPITAGGIGVDTVGYAHPILNCGQTGSDSSPAGPGVCAIVSTGNPVETYDGTPLQMAALSPGSPYATCTGTTYGCGRPNIFQGTQAAFLAQTNAIVFNGVPIDAPGTTTNRTLRFTNIRADATRFGAAAAFGFVPIVATISFSNQNALGLGNIQVTVASVEKGLAATVISNTNYLQCIGVDHNGGQGVTFVEGFDDAWKPANWSYFAGTDGQGGAAGTNSSNGTYAFGTNYTYGGSSYYYHPSYIAQDVPGALYYSESGFYYPGCGSTVIEPNPQNPPPGQSNTSVYVHSRNTPLCSASGSGIDGAGRSDHGTRLAIQFANIPNGSTISVPTEVLLKNQVTGNTTGVMVLTSTDGSGAGSYSPPSSSNTGVATYVNVSNNLVVYEVLFDDPLSLESATVNVAVTYTPNLGSDLPATGERQIGTAAGGFAPFYSSSPANQPSASMDIPRFVFTGTPQTLYDISRCACNLLFPWVASTGGFDTGIALANTSLDPGAAAGFSAVPQSGVVNFWYYGSGPGGTAPPGMQTSAKVPSGSVLTYVLSSGGGNIYSTGSGILPNGMTNAAAGFAGYIIAQAQFQYCHAFVYVSALGAGPTSSGISEGYVALVLDKTTVDVNNGNLRRTVQSLSDQLEN